MEPNITQTITIDLAKYGSAGTIVMSKPTFRMKNKLMNALGNCTKSCMKDGRAEIEQTNIGDAKIVNVIYYVRAAPFGVSLNAFLDFCDALDNNGVGNAEALFAEMEEAVAAIDRGDTSPFQDSVPAETPSSD